MTEVNVLSIVGHTVRINESVLFTFKTICSPISKWQSCIADCDKYKKEESP